MSTSAFNQPGLSVAGDLRAVMAGKVVMAGQDAYAGVRQIWNGAVDHQPAVIALCETAEDVQAAMHIARKHDFPLSVRGGGHDWAGRALRHHGLVIDLTRMRQVDVDVSRGVATVAGVDEVGVGALAGPVVAAAVILAPDATIDGLADSKLLTPKRRQALFIRIGELAVAIATGRA